MMDKPIVTVIIPVFNRPEQAVEAINSVLCQSFSNIEVIVVDDGSNPTLLLPEAIRDDHRVSIVRLTQNMGQSAARNAGIKVARGKWIAWLDSDDLWHSDKLEIQLNRLIELGEEAGFTAMACGFEYRDDNGDCDERIPISASKPELFFSGCWFCPGSTIMLSRSLFDRVGPYDEKMSRLEDLDWFIRMSLIEGRLKIVPNNLVIIRKGEKADYERVRTAGAYFLKKIIAMQGEIPQGAIRSLQAYLNLEYTASALQKNRNWVLGLWHLLVSLYFQPRIKLHLHDFWQRKRWK